MSKSFTKLINNLEKVLLSYHTPVIAVSGGVDSMTLSSFAQLTLGKKKVRMVHAISPAVPKAGTMRVKVQSEIEGWNIQFIDAGEFSDNRYLENPVNRCFFCKSNLYETLSQLATGTILSGTNVDDLDDYRPGLQAAENNSVCHPFVEAGFEKSDLRLLAKSLGLSELSILPASPCLSSRVQTGIKIREDDLASIDSYEVWFQGTFSPEVVRCRIRVAGITIELDDATLKSLSEQDRDRIEMEALNYFPQFGRVSVVISEYKQGSAFVGKKI